MMQRTFPEATDSHISALIGGFFFLRFINPAIVSPHAYQIMDSTPKPNTRRTLTLIAKILQHATNQPTKESYMDAFRTPELLDKLNEFLQTVCEVPDFHDALEVNNLINE
jgi:Ras GTPase-activating-like protein IQGAP2/3